MEEQLTVAAPMLIAQPTRRDCNELIVISTMGLFQLNLEHQWSLEFNMLISHVHRIVHIESVHIQSVVDIYPRKKPAGGWFDVV